MEKKSWERLNKDISWSTKIYVLVALLVGMGSFVFQAWSTNWALTIIVVIIITLLFEYLLVFSHRHPKTWRSIKWLVLLVLLAMLLLGLG